MKRQILLTAYITHEGASLLHQKLLRDVKWVMRCQKRNPSRFKPDGFAPMGLGAINLNLVFKTKKLVDYFVERKKMPRSNQTRPGRGIPMKAAPRRLGAGTIGTYTKS